MNGLHLTADLQGCSSAGLLGDADALRRLALASVQEAGLTPVGELFHRFGAGGGVTGVVLLAESHLALHTWPEIAAVTLDVYVCSYTSDNSAKAERLFDALMQAFQPADPHLHRVVRA